MVAATIANVNRGQDTKPYQPGDFMPQWSQGKASEAQEAPPTDNERLDGLLAWAAAMGASVVVKDS